jgi:hypothetical protein
MAWCLIKQWIRPYGWYLIKQKDKFTLHLSYAWPGILPEVGSENGADWLVEGMFLISHFNISVKTLLLSYSTEFS